MWIIGIGLGLLLLLAGLPVKNRICRRAVMLAGGALLALSLAYVGLVLCLLQGID